MTKIGYGLWLVYVTTILLACGNPPKSTLTPTRTVKPPSPTARPTGRPLATEFKFTPQYVATRTPFPTYSTPLEFPPSPTSPATPLPLEHYRLLAWSEPQAREALDVIRAHWLAEKEAENWIYAQWGINERLAHLAVLEEEVVWRSSLLSQPAAEKLQWSIARDYAQGGNQQATIILADLLEQALNQPATSPPDFERFLAEGFLIIATDVPNLFGIQQAGWVLQATLKDDDANGGAVLSVRQTEEQSYQVERIASFWAPYHVNSFKTDVHTHKPNDIPEIIVDLNLHYGGTSMYADWACIYRWDKYQWSSMFDTSYVMNPSESLNWIVGYLGKQPCVVAEGGSDWHYQTSSAPAHTVIEFAGWVSLPFKCDWRIKRVFTKNSSRYLPTALFLENMNDLAPECFIETWRQAEQISDFSSFIHSMEGQFNNLSNLTFKTDWATSLSQFAPEANDQFRFQLGRIYALAGKEAHAQVVFKTMQTSPLVQSNHWRKMAWEYGQALPNVERAEQQYQASLPVTTPRAEDELRLALREFAQYLFANNKDIATHIAPLREKLARYADCRLPDLCAEAEYLLGVVYETQHDERAAVNAYWRVASLYPESYYALMARGRLEEVK